MSFKQNSLGSVEYQRIFEASPSLYLILAPELAIVAVNDAYLKATMTRREDICGRYLFDVFPDNPDEPNATGVHNLSASLARVIETRTADTMAIQKYDIPRRPEEGGGFEERYWSTVNSPVFDESGSPIYIIHRVEDVTDLIRLHENLTKSPKDTQANAHRLVTELFLRNKEISELNEHLRHTNSELSRINQNKTEFFQNISHEFRTPLALIIGPLEQILVKSAALDEELQQQSTLAHRNALRLLKLINSLLEFTQVETGRAWATFEPTDLAALTSDLASNFRAAIERAGLHLSVHCPPLPEMVYVDREMWETIVLNLISNAFKFTRQGQITVALTRHGNHVELSVSDTGVGIAEHELPHIFERFHRIKRNAARVQEGAGIGLALVKELAALHHGRVRAKSIPGQGSTFIVEIPFGYTHLPIEAIASPEHEPAHPTAMSNAYVQEALSWLPEQSQGETADDALNQPAEKKRFHILLVEDNADMRGYISRLLSEQYDVVPVADSLSALASIRERPPDLVLADLMLTGMSGFELLKEIRGNAASATLPVIIVSGSNGPNSVVEGLAAGADDYLVKPFQSQELLARIAAQLTQAEYIRHERILRQQTENMKSRLEIVLESIDDAVVGVDNTGRITYLNGRAAQLARRRKVKLIGADLSTVFPGEDSNQIREGFLRVLQSKVPTRIEYFSKAYSSWFETRIFLTPGGAIVFSTDISRRKQAEQQLQEALARLRIASEMAELGFWEWDTSSDTVYFSREWKRQLGYAEDELPDRIDEWKSRLHPDDRERVLQQVAHFALAPSPDFEIEYRMKHRDGDYRWINARWVSLASVGLGTDRQLVVTHLNVTAKKQEAERLSYVASHDELTGLPNRLMLHEFAEHILATARRSGNVVAVLFFDLDRFKDINDTYGHKIGDRVLQEAARRIDQRIRAEDLVGRLGGDEFVAVLAPIKGQRDIVHIAAHLLKTLAQPYLIEELELHSPPSIGISLFPDDGNSIETLIQNADAAMYQAKKRGGGCYQFYAQGLT